MVNAATNILRDFDSGGQATYASVNIDARRDPPYEMFVFREPRYKNPSAKVGHLPGPARGARATYRYHSRDGKGWKGPAIHRSERRLLHPPCKRCTSTGALRTPA